jgi:hypothetical protein
MSVVHRSRGTVLGIAAAAMSVVVVTGGPASASAHSIKLSGPHSNTLGSPFTYKITGHAGGPANYVVVWEQGKKRNGCAKTYAAESTRTYQPKYSLGLAKNHKAKGHFKMTILFQANSPGTHLLCGYLINLASGKTYAHAGASWNNHS